MEALAGRLYLRYGGRYLVVAETAILVLLFLAVLTPALAAVIAILELDRHEAMRLLATAVPTYVVCTFGSFRVTRRRLGALRRWLEGDRSQPAVVWAVVEATPRWYLNHLIGFVGTIFAATMLWTLLAVGVDGWSVFSMGVGTAISMACAWIGFVVLTEALFRPVLTDVARHLDEPPPNVGSTRMTWRLSAALMAAAFPTGMAAAAATTYADSTTARMAWTIAGSTAMALYVGAIFTSFIVRPVLQPIRELTAGTARVRAGDLGQSIPVTTSDELGGLVSSFNTMQQGLAERASLHAAFGSYVDPGLAERLVTQGHSTFSGELVDVSVFFVDMRGFTSYSETVEPDEALALLNELFGVVVPIVRNHGGHTNRYLGDGVLAVFGAPEPLVDHADRALAAARSIQLDVSERFGGGVRVGIGINSGAVLAGTVGGGGKLEYTVIGDPVNVAARVEELTKSTGDGVLLTDATRCALTSADGLVDRGEHDVRGKTSRVRLYAG